MGLTGVFMSFKWSMSFELSFTRNALSIESSVEKTQIQMVKYSTQDTISQSGFILEHHDLDK